MYSVQRKKCNSKGEPTYMTKDKHQIEKMPNKLDVDDLSQIWRKYKIPSSVKMMLVSHHLYNTNDPLVMWWAIQSIAFKLRLKCPFPKTVANVLNTFDINIVQVNLNGLWSLLCLSIVAGEHEMEL